MSRPRLSVFRSTAIYSCCALGLLLPNLGCGVFKSLAGKNTVDLEGAEVDAMSVDIRRTEKTICPREPVQMAVFLDIIPKGEKAKKSFETWTGHGGVNKNDKLEFSEFAFHSDDGAFDEEGWFTPNRDLRASLAKELELKTVFKRRPDKFSFDAKYKPSYGCITSAGKTGTSGASGQSGSSGERGRDGNLASSTGSGGPGSEGQPGRPGGNGGDGGDGPRITAFATLVKTPFYDQLVAVRVTGDVDDFLLFPIDRPIVLTAKGGSGGPGGSGGSGGGGGHGGGGNPGGNGGNGGRGADGGSGGRGGKGGEVELVLDTKHAATLGPLFKIEVGGGSEGQPGSGGTAGTRGTGGGPIGNTAKRGGDGAEGARGSSGRAGTRGADGRSTVKSGPVGDPFGGIAGLTIIGADAPPPEPKDLKAKPKGKK